MNAWTRASLLLLTGLAVACGGKPDATKKAPAPNAAKPAAPAVTQKAPAQPATPAAPTAAPASPAAADAKATGGQPAAGTPEAGVTSAPNVSPMVGGHPDPKAPLVSRETLEKAYLEIYCAQRKGEADKLATIFERYGFRDPRAWTAAWTAAVEDQAWVARLTQQAMASCP